VSETEWAVQVNDSAPGQGEAIEPMGDRQRAEARVAYYRRLNSTRGTYGIGAWVVWRYTFMPDMPWERL
jgi:hypothetical protein